MNVLHAVRRSAFVALATAGLSACSVKPPPQEAEQAPRDESPRASTPVADAAKKAGVFLVDDYPGETDRERINTALAAMREVEGPKTLRFATREYVVTPDAFDSLEPVLGVEGVSDLTIDGQGARIVLKDALDVQNGYVFAIRRFRHLVVMDLVLTFRPALFVQGRIVRVDPAANRTAVVLDPAFDHIHLLRRTPYSRILARVGEPLNPVWPKPGSPSWMDVETAEDGAIRYTVQPGNVVEVGMGGIDRDVAVDAATTWAPGDPVVIWKRAGQDGFLFEDGQGLAVRGLRVESVPHYAIKLRGVTDGKVKACRVAPMPGAMFSSAADGIDIQQCRNISITDNILVATGDDAISALNHGHGDNGVLVERKFPPPFPETNEDIVLRDNRIEGGNRNGILLLATRAEVVGNRIEHVRQYGLKFTGDDTRIEDNLFREAGGFTAYRHIADELDTGVICSDEWVQHRVIIRGNRIEDWHNMPGILLKSVHGAQVSDNVLAMSDASRIARRPNNPYLDHLKAIVVTTGSFDGGVTRSSEVEIRGNEVRASGGWTSIPDAIVIRGDHGPVDLRENRLSRHATP